MSNVYEIITDQIIQELEKGNIPWRKPWGGPECEPKNLISKKNYKGINFFLLSMLGFNEPYFVTFKQAKQLGGNVKKGEKGFPVIFWKINVKPVTGPEKKNGQGETTQDKYAFMKYYKVFNISQCEGINPEKIPVIPDFEKLDFSPILEAEKVANGYIGKPAIQCLNNQASYSPVLDTINMPQKENFHGTEEYYSTLFHELVHSTGHFKRLNRPEITATHNFGSMDYSREELVAELGAAFLCSQSGINNTLENSVAYIQSWLKKLKVKENIKWIVEASSKAQKAANYINGDLAKA